MKKRAISIGERFGRLTVIGLAGEEQYRCRCDCGREVIRQRRTLLYHGKDIKCGTHCPIDIVGKERSGAIVIGINPDKQSYIYKCEKCGREFEVPYDDLNNYRYDLTICPDCHRKKILATRESNKQSIINYYKSGSYLNANKKGKNMKVRGVTYDKGKNLWRAVIYIDGSRLHLGYFPSEEMAASARLEAEKVYFPHLAN